MWNVGILFSLSEVHSFVARIRMNACITIRLKPITYQEDFRHNVTSNLFVKKKLSTPVLAV